MKEKSREQNAMSASDDTVFGRQWRMIEWLSESSQGVTVEELASRGECSGRTVRRLLARLRELDVPLVESVGEGGVKTFRIAAAGGDGGLNLTFDEIVAVYISRRFMEPMMGTFLWQAMHRALTKLRRHIGIAAIRQFERSIRVLETTAFGRGDYEPFADIIDELTQAMERRRQVQMLYQSASERQPTLRKVDPYLFVYNDGSLYFVGYSHKSRRISTWKVDRVQSLTVTNTAFQPHEQFQPADHLRQSFGIFKTAAEEPPQTIRIRFAADYARRVREKRWHATERYTDQPDGSTILTFDFPGIEAIKRWVIQFGRYAEVLEPQGLREMVAGELEKSLAHYRN